MSQRFIVTKEHRRFTEFAGAVRRGHTVLYTPSVRPSGSRPMKRGIPEA